MKFRKVLIVFMVSILLGGCGAKRDNQGFIEVTKKEKTVTTVTTKEKPIISDVDIDEYEHLEQSEEPAENIENFNEEECVTTRTFTEPETIIPTQTTKNWKINTTTTKNTSEVVETSNNSSVSKLTKTTTAETEQPIIVTDETSVYTDVSPEPVETQNGGIRDLPESIQNTVDYWKSVYPGMSIGMGIYSLDGLSGYEYNAYQYFNSACSIKAAYAMYVCQSCDQKGIDIWSETIQYLPRHKDEGTSVISDYGTYYEYYTIARLLELLLGESDNTAYTMLTDEFPVSGMYQLIAPLGGQSDWNKWGSASVAQRKNEWLAIYRYVNSGATYANTLRQYLTNTNYCYLVQGMYNWHSYMHKSGWTEDSPSYPACSDAAIIDDSYLIVVMSQDYSTAIGHYDAIQGIGNAVEQYFYYNGYIF